MKKVILFNVVLISIVIAISSCSGGTSTSDPEKIGKEVFGIIKKISSDSKSDYIDNFFSIKDYRDLGKNKKVIRDEETRNEMTSMTKRRWEEQIENDYNRIKEKGATAGIKWDEIEYLDFIYEVEDDDEGELCFGKLYFEFDNDSYSVESISIFDGKDYQLVEIEDFRAQ